MESKSKVYKNPALTVDIIIYDKNLNSVVLIERKNPPFGWALPGGFVDYGECVEVAATREALEETNLSCELLCQFHTYSDPARDNRGHTVSVVFIATGEGELKGLDDAKQAKWYNLNKLPNLAFDHSKILNDFKKEYLEGNKNFFIQK